MEIVFIDEKGGEGVQDHDIIELYFARDERAISETAQKYGGYCESIAMNILSDRMDAEECVNDTWLRTWNAIPPTRPSVLRVFLGKITRNLSLDKYKARTAEKRAGGEFAVSLDELDECIGAVDERESALIGESISRFLRTEGEEARKMFVCRYYYCDSIADIAKRFRVSEGKVKTLLFRVRGRLRNHLEKEGIAL